MTIISYKFVLILAMILLGYLAKKTKILKSGDGDTLTRIVFNFTLPAIIITAFGDFVPTLQDAVFPLAGLLLGVIMLFISLILFRKFPSRDKGLATMPLLGLNVGLFAVPLVQTIWGESISKYLLLIDIGNAFVIFIICYIVAVHNSNDGKKLDIKLIFRSIFKSVPLISYVLTMGLRLADLYYPPFVIDIAAIIAKANTPIAMITLGAFLSFSIDKAGIKLISWSILTKYITAAILGVLFYFFVPIDDPYKTIILISFILPSSFSVLAYAVNFKYDTKIAGAIVNTSIIISLVMLWIYALVVKSPPSA